MYDFVGDAALNIVDPDDDTLLVLRGFLSLGSFSSLYRDEFLVEVLLNLFLKLKIELDEDRDSFSEDR